jgi:hypothetical protein
MRFFPVTLLILMMILPGCAVHFYRMERDIVHIYLKNPEARTVSFAYSQDGYRPRAAKRIDSKTWVVTVPAGSEFSYFYIIDDEVFVPPCACTEKDDFGSRNCIFVPGM